MAFGPIDPTAMQLADVNVLVNAHREENPGHDFYRSWLSSHINDTGTFLYCEWILSAFVRIVTHPRIYRDPTPLDVAVEFAAAVRDRPNGIGIMPGARHWGLFEELCSRHGGRGNDIPDAYLAALAIEAGCTWVTADRDFERYRPRLKVVVLRA